VVSRNLMVEVTTESVASMSALLVFLAVQVHQFVIWRCWSGPKADSQLNQVEWWAVHSIQGMPRRQAIRGLPETMSVREPTVWPPWLKLATVCGEAKPLSIFIRSASVRGGGRKECPVCWAHEGCRWTRSLLGRDW